MAKSSMQAAFDLLEREILETFLAGHRKARPDLSYPQSHSDMQSGIRALLVMFDIKRRPIALDWKELFEPAAALAPNSEKGINDGPDVSRGTRS